MQLPPKGHALLLRRNAAFFYNAISNFSIPIADIQAAAATPADTVGVCGR